MIHRVLAALSCVAVSIGVLQAQQVTFDRIQHPEKEPRNWLSGFVRALDPHTLTKQWEFKMNDVTWAGVLTTASDVAFTGGREGYFVALDARRGDLLWRVSLGGQINSGPMTYATNGKQYVTVAAGNSLFAFALR